MSLQSVLDEQNSLARPTEANMAGIVSALVLKDGTYNNQLGKASKLSAGDVFTTRSQYAGQLGEAGLVSLDVAPALLASEPEEKPEPTEALFTSAGVSDTVNEALLAIGATWEKINEMDVKALTKVPGLGPKGAKKLKALAKIEVAK